VKVLHLINTLSAGGAELHLFTLCRYLRRQGLEVVVSCLREQVKDSRSLRAEFENEGIRVAHLRANSRYNIRFFVRLTRLLREEQPAVLHSHLPRADLAAALALLLYPRVLWICSIHGIYEETWSGRWTLPLFKFVWHRADSIVAISQAVKDWLVKKHGLPPDKVVVVHYGIEPEKFFVPKTNLRKAWGLERRIVIGSMGRLEQGKRYECLIRAILILLRQVPEVFLVIAGHDPWGYGKKLQTLIERLGLEENVRLVGFQSDIASFIGALDVFAFASRSEGFGQVLIEAMAAGKPVVAGRIPPFTEIVADGETGLLVELESPESFAEAIAWFLSHPDKTAQMGRQGQERVRNYFSMEQKVVQTFSLYKRLIERNGTFATG
jgi:glycosyltransferase involved in cell wall biosynthesis